MKNSRFWMIMEKLAEKYPLLALTLLWVWLMYLTTVPLLWELIRR